MSCDGSSFLDALVSVPEVASDEPNAEAPVESVSPQAEEAVKFDEKAYRKQWAKKRYEERKAAGLCPNCGRTKPDGQWLCEYCHDVRKRRNSNKIEYDRRRKEGLCVACGEPNPERTAYCEACAEKKNARKRKPAWEKKPKAPTRKEKMAIAEATGKCTCCFKNDATEGYKTCPDCRDRATKNYHRLKNAGRCTSCGEPAVEGSIHCAECREYNNTRGNESNAKAKAEAVAAYGGRCSCCGEKEILFLQIDHINNDGAEKRRSGEDGLGATLYRQLKSRGWPDGYQVLCANCNFGKSKNGGVCPHVTKKDDQASEPFVMPF